MLTLANFGSSFLSQFCMFWYARFLYHVEAFICIQCIVRQRHTHISTCPHIDTLPYMHRQIMQKCIYFSRQFFELPNFIHTLGTNVVWTQITYLGLDSLERVTYPYIAFSFLELWVAKYTVQVRKACASFMYIPVHYKTKRETRNGLSN